MTAATLTDAQRRALEVLVAAETGQPDRRPVRMGDRTTADTRQREMLTVHTWVARAFVFDGFVVVTNDVLRTVVLSDTGRELAREAGLL